MFNIDILRKCIVSFWIITIIFSAFQRNSYSQGREKIYWTEHDKIRRANLDGSAVEDILTNLDWPTDIALDLVNLKMYWVNSAASRVYRADLDGSDIEVIIDSDVNIEDDGNGKHSPHCIAIDTDADKMYWGNWPRLSGIARSNTDGTNIEDFVIKPVGEMVFGPRVDAEKIQLDIKNRKLYLADSLNDNIARVDLDGSNYKVLDTGLIQYDGIALDIPSNQLYWSYSIPGWMRRMSLDGKNRENLLEDLKFPTDLALDLHSRRMYWANHDFEKQIGKIQHANLDGSDITVIYNTKNRIDGIALDTIGVYDVKLEINKITTTWADIKAQ